jgi:hypothetical protein
MAGLLVYIGKDKTNKWRKKLKPGHVLEVHRNARCTENLEANPRLAIIICSFLRYENALFLTKPILNKKTKPLKRRRFTINLKKLTKDEQKELFETQRLVVLDFERILLSGIKKKTLLRERFGWRENK